ncbi:MAG: DUF4405 domain-containing protein [Anaeroplasmataceae bacterium]|nr:DUF4405 domain-containing protein [Anaeroplasmataceae bacterium]
MAKKIIKLFVDAVMFVLFLLLMEEHLISDGIHEWLGITLFLLFIIHLLLNIKWFSKIGKGKYSGYRITLLVVDLNLAVAMICCILSSIFVSGVVFAGLNLRGKEFGRTLHLVSTAWAFILMAIHLGLHWNMAVGMTKKLPLSKFKRSILKWGFRVIVLGLCIYGIVIFIERRFYEELFFITSFKSFDMSVPTFVYFFQTFALAVVFIGATYYIKSICIFVKKEQRNEKTN